tara:strand:+ start:487 stop:747 length:261 start_codon:yes stop_codon:yes gene_type:complete
MNELQHGLKMESYIKFVGVPFESNNYKKGQDELNQTISQGYRIVRDYQTSSGVVFSLTKNLDNEVIDPKQKLMDDYCVGVTAGVSQ